MGRVIAILIVAVVLAVILLSAGRVLHAVVKTTEEADVPETAKTISYVLLIVLMFGVVSGWLGGL